jgi:hypothetical protein
VIHGKPSTEIKSRQYVDRLLGESRTRKLLYIAQVRKRYFISPYGAILRITYSRKSNANIPSLRGHLRKISCCPGHFSRGKQ